MRYWILFLQFLLFISVPEVLARRGGGGGGGGDEDGGSGSDNNPDSDSGDGTNSDGSSSDDSNCSIQLYDHPPIWKWDLLPFSATNETVGEGDGQGYHGSFFKGDVVLRFTITAGEYCDPNDKEPINMLGYAWVGPQPSYPEGPMNPVIIGIKAWESDKSLDEIDDSYTYIKRDDYCPQKPELFRVVTTHSWLDRKQGTMVTQATDFMNLTVTDDQSAGSQDKVLLNATMPDKLDHEPEGDGLLLMLPKGACGSPLQYHFSLPDRLTINGALTSKTLNMTLSGRGNATAILEGSDRDYELTAEFNLTFFGAFDSVNSTEKVDLNQSDGPLVAWKRNSGLRVSPSLGWISSLVVTGVVTLASFM